MGEPTFTTEKVTLSPDCYMVKVRVSTAPGLVHKFTAKTEREVDARARAFIAGERAAYYKFMAGIEARRQGRALSSLKPVLTAADSPEGEAA